MAQKHTKQKENIFEKIIPFIKQGLYVLLFVLVSIELIKVLPLPFLSKHQPIYPQQPLSEEQPAHIKAEEKNVQETPQPTEEWGKAKQLDEHTWTIKVGEDKEMATPEDILTALNVYRQQHGSNPLTPDEKLNSYAQERADYFALIKSTDKHAGFTKFVNDEEGFNKLGFNALGENSSYGFHVMGVHLIEWVYAGDEPHNKNQLNPEWTHVGIGVNGTATNLIFGGKKQ
jgi:uncharacterized protein YkwD